jgi:hypothetical protein
MVVIRGGCLGVVEAIFKGEALDDEQRDDRRKVSCDTTE